MKNKYNVLMYKRGFATSHVCNIFILSLYTHMYKFVYRLSAVMLTYFIRYLPNVDFILKIENVILLIILVFLLKILQK